MIKSIYETRMGNKLKIDRSDSRDIRSIVSSDLNKFQHIDNNTVRVYKTNIATITSIVTDPVFSSQTGTTTISHDLGFVPYCVAFYNVPGTKRYKPIPDYYFSVTGAGFRGDFRINTYVSDKTIRFEAFSTNLISVPIPIMIKYSLFREPIL